MFPLSALKGFAISCHIIYAMPSTTMPNALSKLVQEFEGIEDFDERAELLIEFAERFEEVPSSIAARPFPESHKVPGCESEAYVWVLGDSTGALMVHFAIENPQGISAKAMAVILQEGLFGQSADSISCIPDDIAYAIFGKGLSMGKGQGLTSMVRVVKYLALHHTH